MDGGFHNIFFKLDNVFVKHYGPNYMPSLKNALTVVLKHHKWINSKVNN